jgi:hypothetical protein
MPSGRVAGKCCAFSGCLKATGNHVHCSITSATSTTLHALLPRGRSCLPTLPQIRLPKRWRPGGEAQAHPRRPLPGRELATRPFLPARSHAFRLQTNGSGPRSPLLSASCRSPLIPSDGEARHLRRTELARSAPRIHDGKHSIRSFALYRRSLPMRRPSRLARGSFEWGASRLS